MPPKDPEVKRNRKSDTDRLRIYGTDGKKELTAQRGKCHTCPTPLNLYGRGTHFHHDHEKGKGHCVAVLCRKCNFREGWLKIQLNDPEPTLRITRMMGPRWEDKLLHLADAIIRARKAQKAT